MQGKVTYTQSESSDIFLEINEIKSMTESNTISHSMVKTPIEDKLSHRSNSIISMETQ